MEGWAVVLLTGCVTLVTSVVTSLITLSLTRKNEIRKHILEKRTQYYFHIYDVIDELVNHPQKVFEDNYMEEFLSNKASMKLLASPKTFEVYKQLLDLVLFPYNAFDVYDGYRQGEDPVYFDQETFAQLTEEDFQLSEEEFMNKFMPDRAEIDRCILNLYQEMRTDLGSNLK